MEHTEDMALNESVMPEDNAPTTPVEKEESGDVATEGISANAGEESEATQESDGKPKKGFESRVRELNARARQAESERDSLRARIEELTSRGEVDYQPYPQMDNEPIFKPGEEIDVLELNNRLQAREQKMLERADALVQLRSKQNEALTRISTETADVLKKYPELDPESESYNKDLSDAVTEATEAYIKGSPYTASVKKFVEKMMQPYKGAVTREVGDMTKSVAKQVTEAAVRPTSVRQKDRPATEKSIAELEKELGIVQS